MIETGGLARYHRKPNIENPTMLRFNVQDVEAAATALRERGVTVNTKQFDWGTVGTIVDPDGNACELKMPTTHSLPDKEMGSHSLHIATQWNWFTQSLHSDLTELVHTVST